MRLRGRAEMSVYVHAAIKREVQRLEVVLESASGQLPEAYLSLVRSAIWDLNECASKIRQRLDLAHRTDEKRRA